nr:myo-inositol hexakisphosphate phosphohydrolase, 90 kda phytase {EC 3.1.3.8, 3.1.3.26} [rats, intestinal mucosa, Peptide Partial, 10 aa] [Rattus sp.]
VIPVEEENPA